MKKSFLKQWLKPLSMFFGGWLLCQPVSAQMNMQFDNNNFRIIPSFFTTSGKHMLYDTNMQSDDSGDERMSYRIYDENFQLAHQFSHSIRILGDKVVYQKKKILSYSSSEKLVETREDVDLEYVRGYVRGSDVEYIETVRDGIHTFEPSKVKEGGTYSKYVFDSSKGTLFIYDIYQHPNYSDSWSDVDKKEYTGSYERGYIFYNVDTGYGSRDSGESFYITQTLFNDDDKYEYVLPEMIRCGEPIVEGIDYFDDGGNLIEIGRRLRYKAKCIAMKVISEDGNVLLRLPVPEVEDYIDPGDLEVYVMNGKTYLAAVQMETYYIYHYNFYELDKTNTSVKQVLSNSSTRILPRVPKRNEVVTVELGKEAANVAHEVMVTSMSGQVVARQTIPAGERRTQLTTGGMASGVYNFTILEKGKRIDNGKIIIR